MAVFVEQDMLAQRELARAIREELTALGVDTTPWRRQDVFGLLRLAERQPEPFSEALQVAIARLEHNLSLPTRMARPRRCCGCEHGMCDSSMASDRNG